MGTCVYCLSTTLMNRSIWLSSRGDQITYNVNRFTDMRFPNTWSVRFSAYCYTARFTLRYLSRWTLTKKKHHTGQPICTPNDRSGKRSASWGCHVTTTLCWVIQNPVWISNRMKTFNNFWTKRNPPKEAYIINTGPRNEMPVSFPVFDAPSE